MHGQKKKNGERFVYFSLISHRLSKICSLGIALPYVYYLYKKGFKFCNCSQCKNYNLNNKPYKNFTRSFLNRKKTSGKINLYITLL